MIRQRVQLKWWTLVGNFSTSIFQYIMIPLMVAECSGYCSGSEGLGSFAGFLGESAVARVHNTPSIPAVFLGYGGNPGVSKLRILQGWVCHGKRSGTRTGVWSMSKLFGFTSVSGGCKGI